MAMVSHEPLVYFNIEIIALKNLACRPSWLHAKSLSDNFNILGEDTSQYSWFHQRLTTLRNLGRTHR